MAHSSTAILDTTLGTVALNMIYDGYMVIVLNEIDPSEKPLWFHKDKVKYMPE